MTSKKDENDNSDIDIRLLEHKIHYFSGEVNNETITEAVKWLLYWDTFPKTTLTLYVNSEGGEVYEAFALIELMKKSKHTIKTIGIGSIMSCGFMIFISGTKGYRYIGKNTGIMYHQHTDSYSNKYHDVKAQMIENDNIVDRFIKCIKEASEFTLADVRKNFSGTTDQYFTAKDLIASGLADKML